MSRQQDPDELASPTTMTRFGRVTRVAAGLRSPSPRESSLPRSTKQAVTPGGTTKRSNSLPKTRNGDGAPQSASRVQLVAVAHVDTSTRLTKKLPTRRRRTIMTEANITVPATPRSSKSYKELQKNEVTLEHENAKLHAELDKMRSKYCSVTEQLSQIKEESAVHQQQKDEEIKALKEYIEEQKVKAWKAEEAIREKYALLEFQYEEAKLEWRDKLEQQGLAATSAAREAEDTITKFKEVLEQHGVDAISLRSIESGATKSRKDRILAGQVQIDNITKFLQQSREKAQAIDKLIDGLARFDAKLAAHGSTGCSEPDRTEENHIAATSEKIEAEIDRRQNYEYDHDDVFYSPERH